MNHRIALGLGSLLIVIGLFMPSKLSFVDAVTDTCSGVATTFTVTAPSSVTAGQAFTLSGISSKPTTSYGVTVSSSSLQLSATNASQTTYAQNNTSTNPSPTTGAPTYTAYYPNWSLTASGSAGSQIIVKLVQAVAVTVEYGTITCPLTMTLVTIDITAPAPPPASGSSSGVPTSNTPTPTAPTTTTSPTITASPSTASSTPTTTTQPVQVDERQQTVQVAAEEPDLSSQTVTQKPNLIYRIIFIFAGISIISIVAMSLFIRRRKLNQSGVLPYFDTHGTTQVFVGDMTTLPSTIAAASAVVAPTHSISNPAGPLQQQNTSIPTPTEIPVQPMATDSSTMPQPNDFVAPKNMIPGNTISTFVPPTPQIIMPTNSSRNSSVGQPVSASLNPPQGMDAGPTVSQGA